MATLKYRTSDGNYVAIPAIQGPIGIGVASIEQTTTSNVSEGNNVWTVTLTDGTTSNLIVKNGAQGAIGPAGGIQDVAASSNEGYITVTNGDGTTKEVAVGAAGDFLPLTGGTLTGELISTNANAFRLIYGNYGMILRNDGNRFWMLPTAAGDPYGSWAITNVSIDFATGALYGAVWNDYAEFRKTVSSAKPGQVVIENGDGSLHLSTKRLEPGANVISDTFGFAIGETDDCKTPIAVSGRVLAYTYEDRNTFVAGEPVCSGPNGTISRMTEQEARDYPWCIVGTVSEIPSYERWGTGNIEVDNRIWIKVR